MQNLPLKLVSLALAAVLWFMIAGENKSYRRKFKPEML